MRLTTLVLFGTTLLLLGACDGPNLPIDTPVPPPVETPAIEFAPVPAETATVIPNVGPTDVGTIQAAVVKACGFYLTVESAKRLLVNLNPFHRDQPIDPSEALIAGVCNAATTKKFAARSESYRGERFRTSNPAVYGTVGGVPIVGYFVK